MPRRKRERLDSVDAESIRELLQMRGWKLIAVRLQRLHAQKQRELVRPQTEIETATLRGFIGGIETALAIPGILQGEVKGGSDGKQRPELD